MPITDRQRQALADATAARTKPIGSRRITKRAVGTDYYEIKVAASGKWMLEHRAVMAKVLGRPLLRTEHVHHKDGDGLNNDPANLEVLTARAHGQLTGKQHGFGTWDRTKPHKCPHCRILHTPPPNKVAWKRPSLEARRPAISTRHQ